MKPTTTVGRTKPRSPELKKPSSQPMAASVSSPAEQNRRWSALGRDISHCIWRDLAILKSSAANCAACGPSSRGQAMEQCGAVCIRGALLLPSCERNRKVRLHSHQAVRCSIHSGVQRTPSNGSNLTRRHASSVNEKKKIGGSFSYVN